MLAPAISYWNPGVGHREIWKERHIREKLFFGWWVGSTVGGWKKTQPCGTPQGTHSGCGGLPRGRAHLNLYVLTQPSIIFCKILNRALSTTHFLNAARKYELRVGRYLCICSLLNLNTLTGAPWQRLTGAPKLFCCTTRFSLFPKN